MGNNLSALEEFDAQRKIQFPHLLFAAADLMSKKKIAYGVLTRKKEELLLISPSGFGEVAVIAGLTEESIEYFAKSAPREYKENLLATMLNSVLVSDAWEIANAMDMDLNNGQMRNQDRLRKVFQYIQDNRAVFQF